MSMCCGIPWLFVICPVLFYAAPVHAEALKSGKAVQSKLKGGDVQEYRIDLQSGQYANVQLNLQTIAATMTVIGPNGQTVFETANATIGAIDTAEWIVIETGVHRIQVIAGDVTAPLGNYTITLVRVELATPQNRARATASQKMAEAFKLWNRHSREATVKAALLMDDALADWRAAKALDDEALTMSWIGFAYTEAGDREKAMRYTTQALPLARASKNRKLEAWSIEYIGTVHNSFGDRRKAIEYFEQALPMMRAEGDLAGECDALNNLGMAHAHTGSLRRALEYFEEAGHIAEGLNHRSMQAIIASNVGVTYGDLGDYGRALDQYLQALSIHRALKSTVSEAITYNNIGTAYSSLADYQKALDAFRSALDIHRSLNRDSDVALNLHNIAWVHANLGDKQRALSLYQDALAIFRNTQERPSMSNTLNNLGETYAELGDREKAMAYHNEALALRRAIGDRRGEATSLSNLGKLHAKLGQKENARTNFEQAVGIFRTTGNRRSLAIALRHYGALNRETGERKRAQELLDEALAISVEIRDRRGEADALGELARLERDRGDLVRAHQRSSEALETLEALRRTVASPTLRASFFTAAQDIQELDIGVLMRMHRDVPDAGFAEAALAGSERAKARSLLELLGESGVQPNNDADPALIRREHELQQAISAKAERQTRTLNSAPSPQSAALARELSSLTAELDDIQSRIRAASSHYAALTQPSPLKLAQIQKKVLDADTVLLEFSLGAERSYLWAVSSSSMNTYELPARAEIDRAARLVYDLLTARNRSVAGETPVARAERLRRADHEYVRAAPILSRMLLGDAASSIAGKRLLIVPDGALQYVPFAALPDPARTDKPAPLMIDHEIVTSPSASVTGVIREEAACRKPASKTLAVFGDPVFGSDDARLSSATVRPGVRSVTDGEFVRLRFSRNEADEIARLAPADATFKAIDFEANRDAVLHLDLHDYRIIHFATHGILDTSHPELSGIVLSRLDREGKTRNGFLRLYDIYNLRLNADLVVLSACDAALGQEIRGEGLIGLTRGFFYAGSRRVLATLWSIDDRTTADLMKRFYESMLVRGQRPAASLRSAQTAMWNTKGWENPYYWAAFTLQGEWR